MADIKTRDEVKGTIKTITCGKILFNTFKFIAFTDRYCFSFLITVSKYYSARKEEIRRTF